MKTMSRCVSLGLAMLLATTPAAAQGRPLELRVDMLSLETSDGNTTIDVEFPGSLAMAFYMSPRFAIEPAIMFSSVSTDVSDGTLYGIGVFFPFYFKADEGRSGFFVSPGAMLAGGSGDYDFDAQVNYGVDVGMKFAAKERISTRLAVTLRDGDSYDKVAVGASFGIGFHWR